MIDRTINWITLAICYHDIYLVLFGYFSGNPFGNLNQGLLCIYETSPSLISVFFEAMDIHCGYGVKLIQEAKSSEESLFPLYWISQ